MKEVMSKDNRQIKYAKKLLMSSKERKKENSFVIEGVRLCIDAINSKKIIKNILCTISFKNKNKEFLKNRKYNLISDSISEYLSETITPQGVFCILEGLDNICTEYDLNNISKTLVLEHIQDPTNLGTILRSSEALGIKDIFLSRDCVDIYNSKVIRGSMGAIFRMNFYIIDNIKKLIIDLKDNRIKCYACVLDENAININEIDFDDRVAVLIGNEGNGLKKETISICSEKITIPMVGKAESLNVAVASSIVMWELTKKNKK